jgi:hypothetical protein
MTITAQVLIEKIRQLPPHRLAELEVFVDFLRLRDNDQRLTQAASQTSQPGFDAVWDNDEDAAYDRI